jgi:UTP:GlnB (protein PII) uridylyltransferase
VKTSIQLVNPPDVPFTRLEVTTMDRPGLLVDIVRTLKDCNVNVLSAEVDTIGAVAKDEFMLAYQGGPLPKAMRTLVRNALGYYLALAEIETAESY